MSRADHLTCDATFPNSMEKANITNVLVHVYRYYRPHYDYLTNNCEQWIAQHQVRYSDEEWRRRNIRCIVCCSVLVIDIARVLERNHHFAWCRKLLSTKFIGRNSHELENSLHWFQSIVNTGKGVIPKEIIFSNDEHASVDRGHRGEGKSDGLSFFALYPIDVSRRKASWVMIGDSMCHVLESLLLVWANAFLCIDHPTDTSVPLYLLNCICVSDICYQIHLSWSLKSSSNDWRTSFVILCCNYTSLICCIFYRE